MITRMVFHMASLPGPFLRVGFFPHTTKITIMLNAIVLNDPSPTNGPGGIFAIFAFFVLTWGLLESIITRRKKKRMREFFK